MYKTNSTLQMQLKEQLQQCSVCDPGNQKSEHASLAQQNGFGTAFSHSLRRLAKRIAKSKEKSVINMIGLLLLVSDLPIIMIDPVGLLLVVSHLFAVPVLVLWVGLEKSK
jgi:hypothetical protein